MQVILVRNQSTQARVISGLWLTIFGALLVALFAFALTATWRLAQQQATGFGERVSTDDLEVLIDQWQSDLQQARGDVDESTSTAEFELSALTARTASLQARLTRLDALGEHLLAVSNIQSDEFDFSSEPAVGGPESEDSSEFSPPDFVEVLATLESQVRERQTQLELLESLIRNRDFEASTFVAGRPIESGWLSSRYGYRTDPFNGKIAWHSGLDFAGRDGSNVIAVAAGVVTYADERSGYGLLVELNHGNGVVTRYAHSKEILVEVGDVVRKGEAVALMGSTGRSTGPHVHFEVLRAGQRVDPSTYIQRRAER